MDKQVTNWHQCTKCKKPCTPMNSGVQHPLGNGEWLSVSDCCLAEVVIAHGDD